MTQGETRQLSTGLANNPQSLAKDKILGSTVRQFTPTSDAVKFRAMQIYAEQGPAIAARRIGVDRKTIDRWRKEFGLPSRRNLPITDDDLARTIKNIQAARMDVRAMLIQKTRLVLSMIDENRKPQEIKDLASAATTMMERFTRDVGHTDTDVPMPATMPPAEQAEMLRLLSDELRQRAARTIDGTPTGAPEQPETVGTTNGLRSLPTEAG